MHTHVFIYILTGATKAPFETKSEISVLTKLRGSTFSPEANPRGAGTRRLRRFSCRELLSRRKNG